ncbi:MAG: hypothetical protein JWQ07_5821 [Ramlibacter sp.]|jgi:hypothetical protein|nr:hypothetical protein [Ramlibacter sp.]
MVATSQTAGTSPKVEMGFRFPDTTGAALFVRTLCRRYVPEGAWTSSVVTALRTSNDAFGSIT